MDSEAQRSKDLPKVTWLVSSRVQILIPIWLQQRRAATKAESRLVLCRLPPSSSFIKCWEHCSQADWIEQAALCKDDCTELQECNILTSTSALACCSRTLKIRSSSLWHKKMVLAQKKTTEWDVDRVDSPFCPFTGKDTAVNSTYKQATSTKMSREPLEHGYLFKTQQLIDYMFFFSSVSWVIIWK